MKIQLTSKNTVDDERLRNDIAKIQDAFNANQTLIEVDAHTSDPTFTTAQDASEKAFIWYNSTTSKLKFRYKGSNTDLH